MPVIIPQESGRSATVERPATAYMSSAYIEAWRMLGWLGAAFFAMSMIDVVLGWYPVSSASFRQEKRRSADYDVMIRMNKSDAVLAISTAKAALRRFGKASKTRRLAFLSLLLFPPRS